MIPEFKDDFTSSEAYGINREVINRKNPHPETLRVRLQVWRRWWDSNPRAVLPTKRFRELFASYRFDTVNTI